MQWSFDQLMGCPEPYVAVIVDEAEREEREAEERRQA